MSFAGRCLPPDFDPGVVEHIDRRRGGNAVAVEWAASPIRRVSRPVAAVLDGIVEPSRMARDYAGLMHRYRPLEGTWTLPVRKLFESGGDAR